MADQKSISKGLVEINRYLALISSNTLKLDAGGKCVLPYGKINLYIFSHPQADLVVFKTFINYLPEPSSGKILALYYHLLDKNDDPDTGEAYFAIVSGDSSVNQKDLISMEIKRPISDISKAELERCIGHVRAASIRYIDELFKNFDAPPVR